MNEMNTSFNPVLVTGASGFVGNCVVRRLLKDGYTVHVLLRKEAKMWRMKDLLDRVQVHRVDLLDASGVHSAVKAAAPAAVLHLAAYGAYESQADARRVLETNILGSYNVLEACMAGSARVIVNTGSSSEYGYYDAPMRESDVLAPNSIYSVAKAAQTHLCSLLAQNGKCGLATFRLFSVYGTWEEPTRLFPTVIRRARAGLPLEMVAPETARDFVCVDDVIDALVNFQALERVKGEVFNLGTGIQSTMRDVVAAVQAAVGTQSEIKWGAMNARKWDAKNWQADATKARRELNWKPRYSLSEGVAIMAAWMAKIGDNYGNE